MNFEAVLAGLPDAVIAVDAELRVVFWNSAAEVLTERSARRAEYTDVLIPEVDRVNRIIEMLLDLARPVQLRPVPLNLHQLLERVAVLNEEGARERGIALVRRYDPSLPPILGDEDRLVQVFHHLVRNALDAMGSGG